MSLLWGNGWDFQITVYFFSGCKTHENFPPHVNYLIRYSCHFPGLLFCKLSKNVPSSQRKKPSTRVTEKPVIPEADPFQEDLMSAVLNGHLDDARQLIADGADVNAEDVHGKRTLIYSFYY